MAGRKKASPKKGAAKPRKRAKAKPKAKASGDFYARIPPQDLEAMPPRKAARVRFGSVTFEAGGAWRGPFTEGTDLETLRDHCVGNPKRCAITFEIKPAEEVIGQKGGPPAPEGEDEVAAAVEPELEDEGEDPADFDTGERSMAPKGGKVDRARQAARGK